MRASRASVCISRLSDRLVPLAVRLHSGGQRETFWYQTHFCNTLLNCEMNKSSAPRNLAFQSL